jgi:hypothetical protein
MISRGVRLQESGDGWTLFLRAGDEEWQVGTLPDFEVGEELEVKVKFVRTAKDVLTFIGVESEREPDFSAFRPRTAAPDDRPKGNHGRRSAASPVATQARADGRSVVCLGKHRLVKKGRLPRDAQSTPKK